jgi:hypothetical protein
VRSREFITLISGAAALPLADRMYEGRLLAVQVIATLLLFNRGLLFRLRRPLSHPTIILLMS